MGTLRTIVENVVGKERPYGKVELFLGEYMDAHGFSRNGLAKRTGLDYKTVDRYYQNKNVERVDLSLLAKFCYSMNCDLTDILRYLPPEND